MQIIKCCCLRPGDNHQWRNGGWWGFYPCVFILREIYKTLCLRIQGSTCAAPPPPLFSPSPISFKPLIKRTSGLYWVPQRERGLIAVKQTTRWCHFSLIMMLPIAVAFIFLSNNVETTGCGHDSDRGHCDGQLRKQTEAVGDSTSVQFTQEAQAEGYLTTTIATWPVTTHAMRRCTQTHRTCS